MFARLLVAAACALVALGATVSSSEADNPAKTEPSRLPAWSTQTRPENSMPRGKLMFERYCAACHGAVPPPPPGAGGPPGANPMAGGPMGGGPMPPPGTAELQVKYGGEVPAELEKRTDLTAETVVYFVRHGSGVMPPIRKTELSDDDLKSLADYLARKN